jgi:hypothetical protein
MSKARFAVNLVLILAAVASFGQWLHAERTPGEHREAPGREIESLAKATCVADCVELPPVQVRCPGSCVSYDRSCPYQRGYVQCSGQAKVYCGEPCPCSVEAFCPEGGSVYCSGTECDGGEGFCYVDCDGQIEFCPGHEGEEFCDEPW